MSSEKLLKHRDLIYLASMVVGAVLLVGLVVFAFTYSDEDLVDKENDAKLVEESHDHDDSDDHSHSGTYEFTSHDGLPEVAISSLEQNAEGQWVLKVDFVNFEIREDKVDQENVPGEGHAHVYVNGEKIDRLFAQEYTFEDSLQNGDVVRVALNTNDHQQYTHDGQPIEVEFTVADENAAAQSHNDTEQGTAHDDHSEEMHDASHAN